MSDDAAPVLCTKADHVATVRLNRPDRRNAWTPGLQRELDVILADLADDDAVRAVVLTGTGNSFCAGADMEVLRGTGGNVANDERAAERISDGLLSLMAIPKPVIAAIDGACAGLGLCIALMCDVRFASSAAKLTTAFSRRGLIAEHGLAWLLPRLTSLTVATELLMSARTFTGEEAAALGVVHRAVPAEHLPAVAHAYARELAVNVSPTSLAVIKWQMYHHADLDLMAAMRHSNELMLESFRRPDLNEGVMSFIEHRQPRFPVLDRDAVPPTTHRFDGHATPPPRPGS